MALGSIIPPKDLATDTRRFFLVPRLLGRRHSSVLSQSLSTAHICYYLLPLFLILNPNNKKTLFSLSNLQHSQTLPFAFFAVKMANVENNPNMNSDENHYSNMPEDEAESVRVIRSRKDPLEGNLDKRVLVGKLIAQKQSNKAGTKNSIRKLWKEYELTQISEVNNNILMFSFKTDQHAAKVLEDSPWFVLGNLLSIQEMLPGKSVSEVKYNLVPFWLQVHGLPFGFLNIDSIRAIVERVGQVQTIEYPIIDGRALRSFTRVRVLIDVSKPLWAGSWITLENNSKIWVVFKYENLQGLCFNCGLLGHEQRDCKLPKIMAPFDKRNPKFGMFLSVDTPKPLALLINEGSMQSQHPSPKPNINHTQPTKLKQAGYRGDEQDQVSEGQGSNDSDRLNLNTRGNAGTEALRKTSQEGTKERRSEEREELIANVVEGVWLGSYGTHHQKEGVIDLTSDTEMDLALNQENNNVPPPCLHWPIVDFNHSKKANLTAKGKAPMLENYQLEIGGPSRPLTRLTSQRNVDDLGNEYTICLPEEDVLQGAKEMMKKLDKVSEQELIQTWNSRFHLKRSREERSSLDEVEAEMVRRKKFKRESWYDAEGNVICVAIISEFGNQTYILDEEGFPKLSSN